MMRTDSFSPAQPDLLIDLVVPDAAPVGSGRGWPVIVWLHGGGWRLQDRSARPDFAKHFARRGFAMASIDYRLAPSARHPAQVCDLRQALRWLRVHAEELRIDPERIGLWGSSAGAHIAAVTALSSHVDVLPGESTTENYADVETRVSCVVGGYPPSAIEALLSPWQDADPSRPTPEEDLLGGPATSAAEHDELVRRAREASPAHLASPAPPPFLLLHGTADAAVPPSQSEALHTHLVALGGQSLLYLIEDFSHGFLNPGDVMELGPGVRLDNGRLEAEPNAPFTAYDRGSFDPQGRPASFDLICEFFAFHLEGPS